MKSGNVFVLKGIVLASLVSDDTCVIFNYAIITNVFEYLEWIEAPSEGNNTISIMNST